MSVETITRYRVPSIAPARQGSTRAMPETAINMKEQTIRIYVIRSFSAMFYRRC